MSAVFVAKYPGVCSECEERITPGDTVMFTGKDVIAHDNCADLTSRKKYAKTCPLCHIQHAGECF